jgi:L-threonine-O-3-phosphate decarboxylase
VPAAGGEQTLPAAGIIMRKISRPTSDLSSLFRHGGVAQPSKVLDYSASINPLGPPRGVLLVLSVLLRLETHQGPSPIAHYPDPACPALVLRIAGQHGVDPPQVVVGNGASELIHALPWAFGCRRVAIVEPTYTEYLRASLLAGAEVEHWLAEGNNFVPEPFDPADADLVWLCNPNNPTGQLWPRGQLEPWMAAHPRTLFALDESFLPFLPDEAEQSLIPAIPRLPNLIVIRSLTKVYGLAGLRLGYAVAAPECADRLRSHLPPWSVNAFAQAAGDVALQEVSFLSQTREWLSQQSPLLRTRLAGCSCCVEPVPGQANFVLLRLRGATSAWATQRLLKRGLAVRDAANFIGLDGQYIRVAVREAADNQRLVRDLATLFGEG